MKQTNKKIREYSKSKILKTDAVPQKCSCKKLFWKYAANLQENTHAVKCDFNKVSIKVNTILLKWLLWLLLYLILFKTQYYLVKMRGGYPWVIQIQKRSVILLKKTLKYLKELKYRIIFVKNLPNFVQSAKINLKLLPKGKTILTKISLAGVVQQYFNRQNFRYCQQRGFQFCFNATLICNN